MDWVRDGGAGFFQPSRNSNWKAGKSSETAERLYEREKTDGYDRGQEEDVPKNVGALAGYVSHLGKVSRMALHDRQGTEWADGQITKPDPMLTSPLEASGLGCPNNW